MHLLNNNQIKFISGSYSEIIHVTQDWKVDKQHAAGVCGSIFGLFLPLPQYMESPNRYSLLGTIGKSLGCSLVGYPLFYGIKKIDNLNLENGKTYIFTYS